MPIDFQLLCGYNYHPVIKMDEQNEWNIELAETVVSEENKEEPLLGRFVCLNCLPRYAVKNQVWVVHTVLPRLDFYLPLI